MAYWSEHEQILTATVAYVGPVGCGKTTSLRALCSTAQHRNESIAGEHSEIETDLANDEGRARVRLRVGLEEPTSLDAPDGVVLVLDARRDAVKRNGDALRELREQMTRLGLSVGEVPVVVQMNHGDDPSAQTSAQMLGALGAGSLPCIDSVATRGQGVNEALREVVQRVRTHVREDDERRAWPSSMPAEAGADRQRSGSFLSVNTLVAELPPLAVNDAPGSFGSVPTPPRPNGPPAAAWGGWVASAAVPSARPSGEPLMGPPSSHGTGRGSLRAVSGGAGPSMGSSVAPTMAELLQMTLERFDTFESTLPLKISGLMSMVARNQDQRLDRMEALLEEMSGQMRAQTEKTQTLGDRIDRYGDEVTAIKTAVESYDEEQIEGGQFRSWTAGRLEDVQAQFVGLSERLRQIGSMLDKLGGRSEEVRGLLEETTAHVGASGMGLTTQLNSLSQQVQALDGQLLALKRDTTEQQSSLARAVSSEVGSALEAASEAAARRMVPALVPALAPAIEEASSGAERRLSAALGGMTATMGRLNTKLGGQDATSLGDRLEAIEDRLATIARQYDPRGSRPSLDAERGSRPSLDADVTPIPAPRAQMASGTQPTEARPGTQATRVTEARPGTQSAMPALPREARPGTQTGGLPREVRPPTQGAGPPPLPVSDELRQGSKKSWWK